MKALVLGGGGAKGSYEVGVFKALRKLHMKFDIVTGVSIGSINGAFYVANEYKKCLKMWQKLIPPEDICFTRSFISSFDILLPIATSNKSDVVIFCHIFCFLLFCIIS